MAARILGEQRRQIVVRLDYGFEVYDLARRQLEDERTHSVRRPIRHLRLSFRRTQRLTSFVHLFVSLSSARLIGLNLESRPPGAVRTLQTP